MVMHTGALFALLCFTSFSLSSDRRTIFYCFQERGNSPSMLQTNSPLLVLCGN